MDETAIKIVDNGTYSPPLDKARLRESKLVAGIFTVLALASALYFMVNTGREYGWLLFLFWSVIGIALYRYYPGYLVIGASRGDQRYGVAQFLLMPQLLITMLLYSDMHLLNWPTLIIPALFSAAVFMAALFYRNPAINPEDATNPKKYLLAAIVPLLMGISFAVTYNYSGISSQITHCPAAIAGKYIETTHNKSNTHYYYHVVLRPWQFGNLAHNVTTSQTWYEALNAGDSLYININYGRFYAPWYSLQGYKTTTTIYQSGIMF